MRAGGCLPQRYDDGGFSGGTMERPALQALLADVRSRQDRRRRRLQGRPPHPLARRLRQARRAVRRARRLVRLGHPAVQHHDLHGPADAQRAALLRAVRAGGHGRAHPRQDRRLEEEGHLDGRPRAARIPGRGQASSSSTRSEAEQVRTIFRRYLELESLTALMQDLERAGSSRRSAGCRSGAVRGGIPFAQGSPRLSPAQPHLPRRDRPSRAASIPASRSRSSTAPCSRPCRRSSPRRLRRAGRRGRARTRF